MADKKWNIINCADIAVVFIRGFSFKSRPGHQMQRVVGGKGCTCYAAGIYPVIERVPIGIHVGMALPVL